MQINSMRSLRAQGNGWNFRVPPPLHDMRIPHRQKCIQTGPPQIVISITVILGEIKTIVRPSQRVVMQHGTCLELPGQLDRVIHVFMVRVKIQRVLTGSISPLNRIQVNINLLGLWLFIIPFVYRVFGSAVRKPLNTMIIQITVEIGKTFFQLHPIRDLVNVWHRHIPYFPFHVIIGKVIINLAVIRLRVAIPLQRVRFVSVHVEHITGHNGCSPDLGRVIIIGITTGHINTSPLS